MKKFKDERIVGYALLIVGLCIMVYSISSVIGVFNGGGVPIKILQSENKETTQNNQSNQSSQQPNLEDIMTPLLPMFNALIWVTIAFFLVAAGGRVTRVGIQMMKVSVPDEVKIIRSEKDNKTELQGKK